MSRWVELGNRVFVRRYAFFDQNIGAVVGDDAVLVVDTRSSHRQAAEIQADLRELTPLPVGAVVNTHGHSDHCFGNRPFRPAPIWGHVRCVAMIEATGEKRRRAAIAEMPEMAEELEEVILDPPDRTFDERATVQVGGRSIDLFHLGRGHTDNDIVLVVRGASVLFAGDLLENGAPPWFGDAYPIEWPATAERLLGMVEGVAVPGHGDPGGREFVASQVAALRAIAELGRRVNDGEIGLDDAVRSAPFPPETARAPIERAVAQLRGDLGS